MVDVLCCVVGVVVIRSVVYVAGVAVVGCIVANVSDVIVGRWL